MTNPQKHHQQFLDSNRPHILMITNHGIHQWDVIPGLPDTGGQNVFVNQFTDTLAKKFKYKITIANRGGYPHPATGTMHTGLDYKNQYQRLLYLEDDKQEFIRKEDMDPQIPQLTQFLFQHLSKEKIPTNLIISHYWDAAKIGILLNQKLSHPATHLWVPHSLGAVKKRNIKPETWTKLKINERIANEKQIIPQLDTIAATSSLIKQSLQTDYNFQHPLFLPPCIQTARFYPKKIDPQHHIWKFLAGHTKLTVKELQNSKIITEISRTDTTKHKDILIQTFARILQDFPQTLLITTIDHLEKQLYQQLNHLISQLKIRPRAIILGNIKHQLPDIYRITDIYCSPSVMEGFGMAVQEAAASAVPVVGSDKIPFVTEYLEPGGGAVTVPADDVTGFTRALTKLLKNDRLRQDMGQKAYHSTIPYFTWDTMTSRLLKQLNK